MIARPDRCRATRPLVPIAMIVLALAACTPSAVEPWRRTSGSAVAPVGETSDCRIQARRQALLRYPEQPLEERFRLPHLDGPDRLEAERFLFRACMRQKGFERAPDA